jgi:hypothetical protein
MLASPSVAGNARYWQGLVAYLCSDNKDEGIVKIKVFKIWDRWNEPALRLEGPAVRPPGLTGHAQNRVQMRS